MKEKKVLKYYRILKIVQLVIVICFECTFFLTLYLNDSLRNCIYTNRNLFILSAMMWTVMTVSLGFLLYDFYKLREVRIHTSLLGKLAYLDASTGIPNRYSCDVIFDLYSNSKKLDNIGCAMFEIANLKQVNETCGKSQGNILIKDFTEILEKTGDKYGFVGRNSGNEYLAVIENCDDTQMQSFVGDLQCQITDYNKMHIAHKLEIHHCYILNSQQKAANFSDLIAAAYNELHS